MKIFFLSLLMLSAVGMQAQSDKYAAAMKKNLGQLDSAKTPDDFKKVSDAFERIGIAEKNQWLPYYYAGLALTTNGWSDTKVDKDANAARVKELCDKAAEISDNSELYVLRNMACTQQMLVDPQTRWATAGKEAGDALKKGMELDPKNPRLYYLQGASLFNTPEQFGGGKAKAKPVLQKAIELYESEKPQPLYPDWGKKMTADMLLKCG